MNCEESYQSDDNYSQQICTKDIPLIQIIGENVKKQFHRAIVAIFFRPFKNLKKNGCGSGVLLSPNIILTSAHNCYNKSQNILYDKTTYRIFIGVDRITNKQYQVEDWCFLDQYKTSKLCNKKQLDYALIKIKIKQNQNNFDYPIITLPCSCIFNRQKILKLQVYGFPAHYKNNYQYCNKDKQMNLIQYGDSEVDSILQIDTFKSKINHTLNTLQGESGSPIIIYGKRIIGIHNGAIKICNIGRLISRDLIQNIVNWCYKLGGIPFEVNQQNSCECYAKQPFYCIRSQKQINMVYHRSIVSLSYYKTKSNQFFGSGVLISPNVVLTAAYNIYLRQYQREVDKNTYKVYIGQQGEATTYYQVESWMYPKQFQSCKSRQRIKMDYAIIKLKTEVKYNQFLPISIPCKCILNKNSSIKLDLYGYPIYNNNYIIKLGSKVFQLYQYGETKKDCILSININSSKIQYNINTKLSTGGCPIVYSNNIIGVHLGPSKLKPFNKFGRLVCNNMIKNLQKWCYQLKAEPIRYNMNGNCRTCYNKMNFYF